MAVAIRANRHARAGPGDGDAAAQLFTEFGIPRSVRRHLKFTAPDSRQAMRDMFADVRMLCHELGLMNPLALLVWRLCRIDGRPSRHRSEPQRMHQPTSV